MTDEQAKLFLEKLTKLPPQLRERFNIAACDPEPEYRAMMQTVTAANERLWLIEVREIFASAREAANYA